MLVHFVHGYNDSSNNNSIIFCLLSSELQDWYIMFYNNNKINNFSVAGKLLLIFLYLHNRKAHCDCSQQIINLLN